MADKPIFVATHPRACSTAFERVFMTRPDLTCIHEPFGDAFYFGPERLSRRYEEDQQARRDSGFEGSTYATVVEGIRRSEGERKRLFIKDIAHYLAPPHGQPASIAPSLGGIPKRGVGTNGSTAAHESTSTSDSPSPPYPYSTSPEAGNPTVIPASILRTFHFTFLIRHPSRSIPSYYRCTIPPLSFVTGFHNFSASEAGYSELRAIFDFLKTEGMIGPRRAGEGDRQEGEVRITVVDADDLLDNPNGIVEAYCAEVGLQYRPEMLSWEGEEEKEKARRAFEKWRGFHEDAIESRDLRPREAGKKKMMKTREELDEEWKEKFGEEAARMIRETVERNLADYEYLKGFALRVPFKEPEKV